MLEDLPLEEYVMGERMLINVPLFTLKFFTVLKSRVESKSQTLA